MEVHQINDNRFDIALELLRDGDSDLIINKVSFALDESIKQLEVRSFTSWKNKPTDQTAFSDIKRGIETYEYLVENSPSFVQTVSGFTPRYSLIDDYGSGTAEICYLSDGHLIWHKPTR